METPMTTSSNGSARKGKAVVTGASSGIGAVYADRLAKRGYDLVLVARRGERLKALAERLRTEAKVAVEVVTADLANAEDLTRVENIVANDPSVTLVVNNAGTATLGASIAA